MRRLVALTLICLACLAGTALAAPGAPPTSPQGLELTGWVVEVPDHPRLGDRALISFTLTNRSGEVVRFHPEFGVFVGARWRHSPGSKKLNRDFGHRHQGERLEPGRSLNYRAVLILDMVGRWSLWPAYNVGGRWGPFDSQKVRLTVAP